MALVRRANLRLHVPATAPRLQPFCPPIAAAVGTTAATTFNLAEVEKLQVLGHGNGGLVYKVRHKTSQAIYALKVVNGGSRSSAAQELGILRLLNSPHVVGFHGVSEKPDGELSFLMEFVDCGTLETYAKIHGPLSEDFIARVAAQVLKGFDYLRAKKVVHHDIKPSNLLINQKFEVKIADFGVSEIVPDGSGRCSSHVGTTAYMSPERFDPETHGPDHDGYAADIWSLGLSLMELYLGRYPYLAEGQKPDWATLMCAICFGDPPRLPEEASADFKDFISCCLQKDARRRWTISQLLQHDFIVERKAQPTSGQTNQENGRMKAKLDPSGFKKKASTR